MTYNQVLNKYVQTRSIQRNSGDKFAKSLIMTLTKFPVVAIHLT